MNDEIFLDFLECSKRCKSISGAMDGHVSEKKQGGGGTKLNFRFGKGDWDKQAGKKN